MANLEVKTQMTALQLAIVVFVTCAGAQIMLSLRSLIAEAGQEAWISVLFGGVIFYVAVYLMLKLGKNYPDETIVEYAPRIFGRVGGGIVIFWFNLLFFCRPLQYFMVWVRSLPFICLIGHHLKL